MKFYGWSTDANQAEIVSKLRQCGLGVLDLSGVGGGAPDLLVFDSESYWLVEIKTEKGKLSKNQIKFHTEHRGPAILVVTTAEEIIEQIGRTPRSRRRREAAYRVADRILALAGGRTEQEGISKKDASEWVSDYLEKMAQTADAGLRKGITKSDYWMFTIPLMDAYEAGKERTLRHLLPRGDK